MSSTIAAEKLREEALTARPPPIIESVHENDRIAVLIDAPNFHASVSSFNARIDFGKFRRLFHERANLAQIIYYVAVNEQSPPETQSKLFNWLQHNGYTIKSKPIKEYPGTGNHHAVRQKGNMDIEIVTDMLMLALSPNSRVNHIVLCSGSGDGDFLPAIKAAQDTGMKVTLISGGNSSHGAPITNNELRKKVNWFCDIGSLMPYIKRDHPEGRQHHD